MPPILTFDSARRGAAYGPVFHLNMADDAQVVLIKDVLEHVRLLRFDVTDFRGPLQVIQSGPLLFLNVLISVSILRRAGRGLRSLQTIIFPVVCFFFGDDLRLRVGESDLGDLSDERK